MHKFPSRLFTEIIKNINYCTINDILDLKRKILIILKTHAPPEIFIYCHVPLKILSFITDYQLIKNTTKIKTNQKV